jgi:hypothetical protein
VDAFEPFIPPDIGGDAHIIRRLGWAVVRQWSALAKDVQERLREQAVFVQDDYHVARLNEQISGFIRKHAKAK